MLNNFLGIFFMDSPTKTLEETRNYKITQNVNTHEIRRDTSSIECFHDILRAYTYVTPQDGSATAASISANFEEKHGNINTIRKFIKNGQVITPMLELILKNKSFPEAGPDIPAYIQQMDHEIAEGRVISYKPSTAVSYEDSIKRRAEVEYLYSSYFNEHKNSLNKILLLTKLANYFSNDILEETIAQMTAENWSSLQETVRAEFNKKLPTKEATNELAVALYINLLQTNGEQIVQSLAERPNLPHIFDFIAEKAILHNKSLVINACVNIYISERLYDNPQLKQATEENALEAMARGNPDICKSFLNKEMWNTYGLETKSCIYSLMIHRVGEQTLLKLLDHIKEENLVIEEAVYIKYIEMNGPQSAALNQSTFKQAAISQTDVAHSRYMAGNIHVTPEDGTISVEELRARSLVGRDPAVQLPKLKEKIASEPEFVFTKALLDNERIITSHMTGNIDNDLRYKPLENFNRCYATNATLRTDVNDSLLLDEVYSDYFNNLALSAGIDPVIKLLTFGIPELLSRESLNKAKEEVVKSNDLPYFIFAANKMHIKVSPRMGIIIANILFDKENNALKQLKENEVFNSEDIIALRFAVLHDKEELVNYCVKKYIKSVKNNQITYPQIHKNMSEQAIFAMVRGNRAISTAFIESMWSISNDVYKAQLVNLIVTRSGKETRNHLIEYLVVNNLLKESLKESLYKSSPIPAEIREIKEFMSPIFDIIKQKQNVIEGYQKSNRTPQEIIEDKPKAKQKLNSFAELTIACIREFGNNNAQWEQFIHANLVKLEKYSSVTPKSFTSHFAKQELTDKAIEFITNIEQISLLGKEENIRAVNEKKLLIEHFNNSNRIPQDILRDKTQPQHLLDSLAELTISCNKRFSKDNSQWNQFIDDNLKDLKKYSSIEKGALAQYFGRHKFTDKADEFIVNLNQHIDLLEQEAKITSTQTQQSIESSSERAPSPKNIDKSLTATTPQHEKEPVTPAIATPLRQEEVKEGEFIDPRAKKQKSKDKALNQSNNEPTLETIKIETSQQKKPSDKKDRDSLQAKSNTADKTPTKSQNPTKKSKDDSQKPNTKNITATINAAEKTKRGSTSAATTSPQETSSSQEIVTDNTISIPVPTNWAAKVSGVKPSPKTLKTKHNEEKTIERTKDSTTISASKTIATAISTQNITTTASKKSINDSQKEKFSGKNSIKFGDFDPITLNPSESSPTGFVAAEEARRSKTPSPDRKSGGISNEVKTSSSTTSSTGFAAKETAQSSSPESPYKHGNLLYTNRGTLVPSIIYKEETYITITAQNNNHYLQKVQFAIEKEEGKRVITDFVGKSTLYDLSSLYARPNYSQTHQQKKSNKEEQQI